MPAKKAASKSAPRRKPKATETPLLDLPEGEARELPPSELILDPENLRLLERLDPQTRQIDVSLYAQPSIQDRLTNLISEDDLFDVKSLVKSIVYNGFLKHERLIVARYDSKHFLVLEGNRRLTAVRSIHKTYGPGLDGLPPAVKQSLATLPCFVLEGDAIGNSSEALKAYRKASEIYIGMRHLMGSKEWEPASRYEFQARLITEDNWTPEDVAERFGRTKAAVLRDLKAQRLYHDFREFERSSQVEHRLTYNAFAEAARASSIMKWLGWSDTDHKVLNKTNERTFFLYLTSRLRSRLKDQTSEGGDETPQQSSESIVRHLREMLKLEDELIQEALADGDFNAADLLFEEKREGEFSKRVANFTRRLRRVSEDELSDNPTENKDKLSELIRQASRTMAMVDALLGLDRK